MVITPNSKQVLFLWSLIFNGENFYKDIKPKLDNVSQKKELIQWGLIQEEKMKTDKKRPANYISVTEKGWKWANDNLHAEFSPKSNATPVLKALLVRLNVFLNNQNLSLAEFLSFKLIKPVEEPISMDLEDRIKNAYYKASGGQWNVRVRLYELRKLLPDIVSNTFDRTLLDMQKQNKLVLYNMDDVQNIRPEDEASAIDIGGFKRHIIYMEK